MINTELIGKVMKKIRVMHPEKKGLNMNHIMLVYGINTYSVKYSIEQGQLKERTHYRFKYNQVSDEVNDVEVLSKVNNPVKWRLVTQGG